jgi:hypothetical protein
MIPKILLQASKDLYPEYVQKMWQERTDDSWTIEWFDDEAIIKFFKDNPLPEFPNIIDVFHSFQDGGHKADLFRYYYLYLNGGFFIDSDLMTHVHMNDIYSPTHDHILVVSDIEVNRFHHPEIDSPVIFNGLMGCVAGSSIVYEALKNAYHVKLRLLKKQRLYFCYMLYTITEKFKHNYNILFYTEEIDENFAHYAYTLNNNNYKIATHFYGYDKIMPAVVELSVDGRVVVGKPVKTITFFTTFHKPGFDLYGKHWLSTFLDNIIKRNSNIFGKVYIENLDPPFDHDKIEFLDFDQTIPDHAAWEAEVKQRSDIVQCPGVMRETVVFSHKAFVIQHALKTITTDYAIWIDADCVFHKESYDQFPQNIMGDNFLACQLEVQKQDHVEWGNHVESGVLVFDMQHPNTAKFAQAFADNYQVEKLKKYVRPFDGYIIARTLEELNSPYTNLNKRYGVPGVQGDEVNTFLHPEIKKRFTHNIGAHGKADYADWDQVKHLDENFKNLDTHVRTHPRSS